jgi:hypothetical protein
VFREIPSHRWTVSQVCWRFSHLWASEYASSVQKLAYISTLNSVLCKCHKKPLTLHIKCPFSFKKACEHQGCLTEKFRAWNLVVTFRSANLVLFILLYRIPRKEVRVLQENVQCFHEVESWRLLR